MFGMDVLIPVTSKACVTLLHHYLSCWTTVCTNLSIVDDITCSCFGFTCAHRSDGVELLSDSVDQIGWQLQRRRTKSDGLELFKSKSTT